ncbi:cytoplasmic dynein 2 light intermediate chain 1-like [Stylophora pistillata]|uniref:cytoplasmic dynein 2 light intermediate chain 1-like n=1 Tax=Stylophora pistillata TaxID=50429 RepID=UPI000C0509BD|nr:cytoplasmic dynein 2 light intermediate chain 1-like [Stylophora pistillata]
MSEKRSEKTIWDLAVEERNRTENHSSKDQQDDSQLSSSDESSIFILGSKNSGKTSIILRFLDRDEAPKPTTALDYTFGRRAKTGHNIGKDVGHIWELGGGTFLSKLIEIPLTSVTIRSMAVVVVVDLSLPNEMWNTMETLLSQVKSKVNKALESLEGKEPSSVQQIKKQAWKKFGEEHPSYKLNGSLILVLQDFDPEKRKMISRALRFVAHKNGAHLQFFSTKAEGLTNRTRGLVGSLLFRTPLSKVISVDHNKPIIVPAGQDSFSQIGAPPVGNQDTGKMHSRDPYELWKAAYATFFPPEKSQGRNTSEDPSKDLQYAEPAVDPMRKQKDEELERYRKLAMRKVKDASRATAGEKHPR